jgi:hypothetical protein
MANINHADSLPSFKRDETENNSETFVSGTTKTVTNANIRANSVILIHNTSARAGRWSVVCSDGSMLITSSDAETNATFKYRIL